MIKAIYKIVELIVVDSYFRTAIGITPDGLVVFRGHLFFVLFLIVQYNILSFN